MNSITTNSPEQYSGHSSESGLPQAESARHQVLDAAIRELEQATVSIEQRFGPQYVQHIPGLGERSIAAATAEANAVSNEELTVATARQNVERAQQMGQGEYA